jgi:hypothetical protein
MRLYAYGGTEFSTRCQIGEWHRIESGALQDKFGLKKESFAIGVGTDERSAFLVFKELQIGTANREYAYTLLLDPGADVWEAAHWNPLHFVGFLLKPERSELVLKTPEKIWENPKLLETLLADIKKELEQGEVSNQPFGGFNEDDDFFFLIAGMGLPGASEIDNALVFHTPRPVFNKLQWKLNDLPEFLRFGQGWFIGGQKENAPSFRLKLIVLDTPEKQSNSVEAQEFVDKGKAFLRNWETIKQIEGFKSVLAKAPSQPINFLSDTGKKNAQEYVSGIEILARLCLQSEIDKNLAAQVKDAVEKQTILAEEIEAVFFQNTFKRDLSPEVSKVWLELQDKRPLGAVKQPRLSGETLGEHFVRNRINPLYSNLNFDFEKGAEILLELINTETDAAKIPEWLESAVKYLNVREPGEQKFREYRRSFLDAALKSTVAKKSLDIWLNYTHNEELFGLVKDSLKLFAQRQVERETPDWRQVYLKFGFDSGGQWLAENHVSSGQINDLIQFINLEIETNSALKEISAEWIDDLATSPLKNSHFDQKRQTDKKSVAGLCLACKHFKKYSEYYS